MTDDEIDTAIKMHEGNFVASPTKFVELIFRNRFKYKLYQNSNKCQKKKEMGPKMLQIKNP